MRGTKHELVHNEEKLMRKNSKKTCPLCGGTKKSGTTTFSADLGSGVVVIRRVPALVCAQCGSDWIEDNVAARLEELVEDARIKHRQVEVSAFA